MRISDWSSDWCSSDLPVVYRCHVGWPGCGDLAVHDFASRHRARSEPEESRDLRKGQHARRRGAEKAPGSRADGGGVAGDPAAIARGTGAGFEPDQGTQIAGHRRSEEHTPELQSLMRISYAVFCLKKKKPQTTQ